MDDVLLRVMDENVASNTEIGNLKSDLQLCALKVAWKTGSRLLKRAKKAGRIHVRSEWV